MLARANDLLHRYETCCLYGARSATDALRFLHDCFVRDANILNAAIETSSD